MRFLNILNQGVDIEKLKEIVNDDSESMSYPPQPPQPPQPLQPSQSRGETYGETSSCTSQGKQNVPNPDEQQKHLQNILQSLGLSLGTDEISKMSDRTQERLYGKRQKEAEGDKTLNEKPQMAMERLLKEGEKYSPAHYTRISSSSSSSLSSRRSPPKTQSLLRQRSHSSSDRHRSYKSSHRYRSPPSSSRRLGRSRSPYRCRNTNSPYRRRDSRSPHERGNTNSPYMRRDSHSIHVWSSPNPGDLGDPLQFQPPTQVCPYPPLQCFNPHFQPPQMYPDPYALCAYNQLPAPPPEFHNQQIEPDNSKSSLEIDNMAGTSNKHRIPVLVYLDQMSVSESWRNTKRFRKYQKYLGMKALKKQQRREFLAKQEQDRAKMCTAAKPAHTSEVPPITAGNNCKKKKKKKKLVFTERTEEMKELLNNRPGPVTRALGKKNPAKLLDYNGKLVDIQDVVVPLRELWDDIPFPVIASMTRTYSEVVITEPKVEEPMLTEEEIKVEEPMLTEEEIKVEEPMLTKEEIKVEEPMLTKEEIKVEEPVLTEEEIKANLKLKLEAFNSRMKKKDAQPAQLLTPHSVKVEENI
ncbi:uncharacterized protein [Eucyclogobius newberryi]|uniref:uncharacterized protein n=1 Tax=Eucyclogobius newberryi TaxID=166745 RepID=UPI003B5CF274